MESLWVLSNPLASMMASTSGGTYIGLRADFFRSSSKISLASSPASKYLNLWRGLRTFMVLGLIVGFQKAKGMVNRRQIGP